MTKKKKKGDPLHDDVADYVIKQLKRYCGTERKGLDNLTKERLQRLFLCCSRLSRRIPSFIKVRKKQSNARNPSEIISQEKSRFQ